MSQDRKNIQSHLEKLSLKGVKLIFGSSGFGLPDREDISQGISASKKEKGIMYIGPASESEKILLGADFKGAEGSYNGRSLVLLAGSTEYHIIPNRASKLVLPAESSSLNQGEKFDYCELRKIGLVM